MISCSGRNQFYESQKVILQDQNVFKRLVSSFEPLVNIKKVVMKDLVWCSSMNCFSQRSRNKWLIIDSAMKATATKRFDILFQRKYSEILLFVRSKDR
jgi:hypothetical protein